MYIYIAEVMAKMEEEHRGMDGAAMAKIQTNVGIFYLKKSSLSSMFDDEPHKISRRVKSRNRRPAPPFVYISLNPYCSIRNRTIFRQRYEFMYLFICIHIYRHG